ncbi:MAG TPA: glycosyltransferase, partial [Kofleriaceae bacterium]|nr:glycosyltransferase [Kofleriaceae bacterium]
MTTLVIVLGYALVLVPLFVYGINSYVLLWWRRRWREPAAWSAVGQWPATAVQIPIYNERDVVARVIDAAGRLRYPGSLLVQVLDDSTDDTSELAAAALSRLRERGVAVQHVRRGDRTGYKAGALAHGMTLTDAELFLVLDADFVPGPDFLIDTVPLLVSPDVACVQARWGHLNRERDGFTRAQALGIDVHFAIEQRARAAARWTVAFNGTAGLWRRTALDAAGGWSADTLTEDLDLSYR